MTRVRKKFLTLPMVMSERESDDLVKYAGMMLPAEVVQAYAADNMVAFDSLPLWERRLYWGVDD